MTKRWTIRAKLTILVLAVMLPLVAAAAVKFWFELDQARRDAQTDMVESAQAVAQLLDELLAAQVANVEVVAGLGASRRIRDEDLVAAATRTKRHYAFVHRLVAVDPDGHVGAASDAPSRGTREIFTAPDALAAALRERSARVGAPAPSASGGRVVVPMVVPVVDGAGAAIGAVAVEIDLAALSAYLDGRTLLHGTFAAVVTSPAGALIGRTAAAGAALGQPVPALPAGTALLRRRSGVGEWQWDGVAAVGAAAPIARAPWTALAGMPRATAYAPAAGGLRRNLIGLAAAALVALGAAWLISRHMTGSVQSLIAGARALAAGTGPRIPVRGDAELAELAEQMNRAMDERQAAEAEVNARQRRIRALGEVNRLISEQLDLETLLHQITRALVQLTGAHNAVLWEVDRAGETLTRRAWTTDPSVGTVDLPFVLTLDEGGTGWIARHREMMFVADIQDDPRIVGVEWALRHGLAAFAGAPVVAGDALLGVLTLNCRRGRLPEGDDRLLLASFASQAAVAIRNARLFAEAAARRRAAETLGNLGRVLAQALDLDVVAQRVADSVRALLHGGSSVLYRVEPGSDDLIGLAVSGDVAPGFGAPIVFPSGAGLVGLAVRQRAPVTTPDVFADPRVELGADLKSRLAQVPYHAALAVPLIAKDTVIGALSVGDRQGRVFSEDEIRLAQAFADQAALALDNARLYEETRQRLRHLDSLRQAVDQILVPISLEERLTVIARKTAELFGADRATIALCDGARGPAVVRAGYGLVPGEVGRVVRPGTGVVGQTLSRRAGIVVDDYQHWAHRDPYIVERYPDRPASAVIGCPLLVRDQTIGVISVGIHTPGRRFVPDDLDRLASLAVPAALAIEHGRLYEELHTRLRELEETQAQLVHAGKLSAIGQLVSGVAHELNNPLSVILGYAQLLAERDLPADLRRTVDIMLAQGNRMTRIVQSLLLFSRQRKAERGAVDVREALEQTVSLRATQLMLSGVRMSIHYGEDVPAAEGDGQQLQQVFLNLILNAEQAILGSGAGGERVGDAIRVTTSTRVDRDGRTWVVVTIGDNGPGIPREALPHIFDPFFTTKKVGEGTGLGLSVSYGIIQQHGGRLSVDSAPGHTVFTIELPAVAEPAARAVHTTVGVGESNGRGRRVLVVDDEPGVVELVSMLLEQSGWHVNTAAGGRAALDQLRRAPYDLVLADMRMAEGSGEDLYRAVAAERRDLTGRFLFMTGDTANADAYRFLAEVHARVIEKPFTAQALLSAVEEAAA